MIAFLALLQLTEKLGRRKFTLIATLVQKMWQRQKQ